MLDIDTLIRKLENEPIRDDSKWARKKEEWLQDLNDVIDQIYTWLKQAQARGVLDLQRHTLSVHEQDIGTYDAPALKIKLKRGAPREIRIEPKGMSVVAAIPAPGRRVQGARGRVDFICGPARAMLLRSPERKWYFVESDRPFSTGEEVLAVSESALAEVLSELLGYDDTLE